MPLKIIKELLSFFPLKGSNKKIEQTELKPGQPIVVLVAGVSSTQNSLRIIQKRLTKEGYNVVVQTLALQNKRAHTQGLVYFSKQLKSLISNLRLKQQYQSSKIFILAHSAGGLIARYYVQELGGDQECSGLITMATPHQGLWLAALGFFTHLALRPKCLIDILPFSHFVKGLNACEYPQGCPLLSLSSMDDFICSVKNTELPLSLSKNSCVETKLLKGTTHVGFLFQRSPYLTLKRWLENQLKNPTIQTKPSKLKKIS